MTAKMIKTEKTEYYVWFQGKRTAADLIEILSQFPQDKPVHIEVEDYDNSESSASFTVSEYK